MWSLLYLFYVRISRWTGVSLVRVREFSLTLQHLCSVWCLCLWVGTVQTGLVHSSLSPFQGSSSAQWKNDGIAVRTNGESGCFGTNKWRKRHILSHLWLRSARLKSSAQSQCYPVVRDAMSIFRKHDYSCLGCGKDETQTSHFTPLFTFHLPLDQELRQQGLSFMAHIRSSVKLWCLPSAHAVMVIASYTSIQCSFPVISIQPWVAGLNKTEIQTHCEGVAARQHTWSVTFIKAALSFSYSSSSSLRWWWHWFICFTSIVGKHDYWAKLKIKQQLFSNTESCFCWSFSLQKRYRVLPLTGEVVLQIDTLWITGNFCPLSLFCVTSGIWSFMSSWLKSEVPFPWKHGEMPLEF